MILSLILGLILGGLSVMFALQNIFPVTVTFLAWEVTASLALLIAISVIVGLVISMLVSIPGAISNAMTVSSLKKDNKRLQDDLEAARSRNQQTVIIKDETRSDPAV